MTNTTTLSASFDRIAFMGDKLPAFIVRDTAGGMLQGMGDTEQAAWDDAVANLASAGITVVDGEPASHSQVRASALVVLEVLPEQTV